MNSQSDGSKKGGRSEEKRQCTHVHCIQISKPPSSGHGLAVALCTRSQGQDWGGLIWAEWLQGRRPDDVGEKRGEVEKEVGRDHARLGVPG